MKRSAVPIVVAVLAAALVGLLVYGVVARRDDTSLDSAVTQRAAAGRARRGGDAARCSTARAGGSLAELRGKVVVLNFWASWCGPCENEAPVLERAQQQLAGSGGTVLGRDLQGRRLPRRATSSSKYKLTYPSLRDDRLDLAPKYGTTKLPETFVIDKAGHVVAMSRGEVSPGLPVAAPSTGRRRS